MNNITKISPKNILFLTVLTVILLYSVLIRTKFLLSALPFEFDENFLLDNIQYRSYRKLFFTLDYNQCCPPLFLVAGKLVFSKFGFNELALRCIPYTAGILSVFSFCYLSFLVFKNKLSVIFANLFFNFSFFSIFYSWIFKQYSFDCLATILVLICAIKLKDKNLSYKEIILLSTLSTILFLFSYTSVIILFSSLCAILIYRLFINKDSENINKKELLLKTGTFLIFPFGIILLILLFINLIPTYFTESLVNYWKNETKEMISVFFLPLTINDYTEIYKFFCPFIFHLTKYNVFIISFYIIFSATILYKKNPFLFSLIIFPIMTAYILGFLYLYPFAADRVSLYLMPIFTLLTTYLIDLIAYNIYYEISIICVFIFCSFINYNENTDVFESFFIPNKDSCNVGERLTKHYINCLNFSDIEQKDYIYVLSVNLFENNDKNKKYKNYFKINRGNDTKSLNFIKNGENIFFWFDETYDYTMEKNWIENNCNIKYSTKNYYGTFTKCEVKK